MKRSKIIFLNLKFNQKIKNDKIFKKSNCKYIKKI